ncbi:MAG: CDP-alcohol phosphatidyltransferase family protein [Acidobacteria bacterium]|nr:CDP-alcohol phosphatidyltransferase family protein [Acidobacteriota bacterium]
MSRIALAMIFVICFQRDPLLLSAAIGSWALALLTDVLDGFLARRLGVASIHGRMWDSLGDKAFYVAVIIAFNAHGFLGVLVSWGLLVREVALYITRVLFIEKLPLIERIRPWTNWHGYFMYATIALGVWRMYAITHGGASSLHPYMQASAYAALAFGIASIVHFLRLR